MRSLSVGLRCKSFARRRACGASHARKRAPWWETRLWFASCMGSSSGASRSDAPRPWNRSWRADFSRNRRRRRWAPDFCDLAMPVWAAFLPFFPSICTYEAALPRRSRCSKGSWHYSKPCNVTAMSASTRMGLAVMHRELLRCRCQQRPDDDVMQGSANACLASNGRAHRFCDEWSGGTVVLILSWAVELGTRTPLIRRP